MKRQLIILVLLVTCASCDPIYTGVLRNLKNEAVEIKICGDDLRAVYSKNQVIQLHSIDSTISCKSVRLEPEETIDIVTASGIAKPITYEDIGFEEIEIYTKDDTLSIKGREVMELFEVKKKRNIFGMHTTDIYLLDITDQK